MSDIWCDRCKNIKPLGLFGGDTTCKCEEYEYRIDDRYDKDDQSSWCGTLWERSPETVAEKVTRSYDEEEIPTIANSDGGESLSIRVRKLSDKEKVFHFYVDGYYQANYTAHPADEYENEHGVE